jgi:hypothetical protein
VLPIGALHSPVDRVRRFSPFFFFLASVLASAVARSCILLEGLLTARA